MSIDEAIKHAREISDCCKSEISTFPNLEPYEKYCNGELEKRADEHEQVAEWLEELKELRKFKNDFTDLGKLYSEIRLEERNKAIDDFKQYLSLETIEKYAESDGFINLNNCSLMICDVAEILKDGVKNESNNRIKELN